MELNVKQSGIQQRIISTSYRKTRGDKIHKRVHELYLRNDIPCGASTCKTCSFADMKPLEVCDNSSYSRSFASNHFLLLDGICILRFIDVLHEDVFKGAVILQSAWNYVKKLNPPIYKRLSNLCSENLGRFFVFLNEFVSETYVDPGVNRVPELYQETCLLRSASYLEKHWKSLGLLPLIICSSVDSKKRISENFPNTVTLLDYVQGVDDCSKIAERISDLGKEETRGKTLFPEYWTQDQLLEGISKGTLKKGKFQVSQENYMEAYVLFDFGDQWFIQGRKHMNRSIQGDVVVAQLLPESEWEAPAKVIRLRDAEEVQDNVIPEEGEQVDDIENQDDSSIPAKKLKKEVIPTAKIVGILRRNWRSYCGIVLPSHIEGGRRFLFAPTERLMPRIRIETSHYEDLKNKKVLVQIDSWPQDSYYPKGHYVRIIGDEGDQATEDEVIMLEHEIPHGEFSPAVLACLPSDDWKPEPSTYRRNLTHLDICSVDPEGCTDIDDALHCIDLGDGRYEVGVHIADVTHFVKPDTAIDKEAAERSTSVYLCGRRIDMLPTVLSSNLCSLIGGQERYAFSVIWILKEDASIESVDFTKSLIRSRLALTYQRAQDMVTNANGEHNDSISKSLRNLMKLSRCLKSRRKLMGALELASSEIRFDMDEKTRAPVNVREKAHLDTMSMVEEFMLLANISVAERTLKAYPDCAILRRHPVPNRESFKPLTIAAESCGFRLNVDTGMELAKSLDEVDRKSKGTTISQMLRMLATRCMTQAVYFAASTVPPDHYLHYGLAAKVYTHFTSPIRRYADVMVHRLLATIIETDRVHPAMVDRKRLIRLTENMNRRHRQAQYASRASILLNTFLMIKEHPEKSVPAMVIGIRSNGIQVMVPKYGLESVIFFKAAEEMTSQEQMIEFVNNRVRLFQEVTVGITLAEKDQRRRINVNLIEPHIEGFSVVTSGGEEQ